VTSDNKFLITSCSSKRVRAVSIENQEVVKDFRRVCSGLIETIQLSPNDSSIYIYDCNCCLKEIRLADGAKIKDYGKVHEKSANWFQRMLVTRDGQYLFTSSDDGNLKQFSVRGKTLVKNISIAGHEIWSICN